MAVTLTKEFWTNLVLFVVACVALGLSIWSLVTPCKKDKFGNTMTNSGLKSCKTPDDCNQNEMEVCVDSNKNVAINSCEDFCDCRSQISEIKYGCSSDDYCPTTSKCIYGLCIKNKFGNSNVNLICDFTNTYNPIQVNNILSGCSTSDVNGVIKFIKNHFYKDISSDCRKGSFL